jgi:LacI family transcriptional regulator
LVLNGRAKGNISAAKQQAVLEAASRLDYSPNIVAQGLRTSRTRILGVLTWQGVGGLPLHLIGSALQTSANAGYMLIKMYAEPTEIDQHRALSTLGNRHVDGILVVAPELCEYQAVEAMSHYPTMLLNCLDPAQQLTSVVPDEEGAGVRAAELLLERGHRDIGLLTGPLVQYQTGLRAQGVQRAVTAAGGAHAQMQTANVRIDSGFAAATELLTQQSRPTALVCTSERLAVGALFAASQLGLRVPDDLSLVSLDDREELTSQLSPEITRVDRPDGLMAAHAADLLIEGVESSSEPKAQSYSFVCPVVEGGSVAEPSRAGSRVS